MSFLIIAFYVVYEHRSAPSIKKEYALMVVDADMNMSNFLGQNLLHHLRQRLPTSL